MIATSGTVFYRGPLAGSVMLFPHNFITVPLRGLFVGFDQGYIVCESERGMGFLGSGFLFFFLVFCLLFCDGRLLFYPIRLFRPEPPAHRKVFLVFGDGITALVTGLL